VGKGESELLRERLSTCIGDREKVLQGPALRRRGFHKAGRGSRSAWRLRERRERWRVKEAEAQGGVVKSEGALRGGLEKGPRFKVFERERALLRAAVVETRACDRAATRASRRRTAGTSVRGREQGE